MSKYNKYGYQLLFCLLSGSLLAGCGAKGDLYLPDAGSMPESEEVIIEPKKRGHSDATRP